MEKLAPEQIRELQAQLLDRHYRGWLDVPVPALGGRTPRSSARLKTLRPKLAALLKEFQLLEDRKPADLGPRYDFVWMWRELGIEELA